MEYFPELPNLRNYNNGLLYDTRHYSKSVIYYLLFIIYKSRPKFNDPKLNNEMFVRIGMKHSFFSNYLFAINFFVLLKLLLFAKN